MADYDYIIIGAGSAGCVLAHRLVAAGQRVLLLEAGPSDRSPWIQVPIGYGKTFVDPRYNWRYETLPDPGLDGRRGYCPRGKVLGGSGSINAMVWVRGHPGDFDDWQAAGNPGWGWQQVLPYFRKCEDYCGGASTYHGAGGPLYIGEVSKAVHPLCASFVDACATLGIPRTADFNGASPEGAGIWQVTIKNGVRVSTANSYLRAARGSALLELKTRAHATRLLFDGRRACGVEYRAGGRTERADARGEILLAAGAINSPQLLQLSGIGDRTLLGRLGIPLRHELPAVGQGLQDHLAASYFFRARVPTLNNELFPLLGRLRAALRYLYARQGPLAMSVNQAGAFVRTDAALARPNLQVYFNPLSYTTTTGLRRKMTRPDPWPGFLLAFNSCRPRSRGSVAIVSVDPLAPPAISSGYLSADADIADVYAGTQLLRRIAAAEPFAALIESEIVPGPAVQSEAALLADFRARAGSVFHCCGSCAMGPDPRRSVVDARLRVHGLERLRVVDASIFPTVTSGNTQAPVVMVAEKAADLILEDALSPSGC